MRECDAFVLPSKYETFGKVVIEAMASGLPAIVTKSGGPESYIIHGENGLIIEQNQIQLEEAMISMMERKWDSQAIRDYVVKNFSEEVVVKKLEEIYESLIY